MKVFSLVYTKVLPDESPWGKTGFHTVFYSDELLIKEDVTDIERKIHFPSSGTTAFDRKTTVFFQKIRGEYHLVIMHIKNLPDDRDKFGRAGIFLCHALIFPPELWLHAPQPMAISELVKDSVFISRDAVLSSPLVNRTTGGIKPFEISPEALAGISGSFAGPGSGFERKMALLLNRLARQPELGVALIVKGAPETISFFMNRMIVFVPNDYKVNLGWDCRFEDGNLMQFPLKIAGFTDASPKGGGTRIEIDPAAQAIRVTPETAGFFEPQTPFERWLWSNPLEASSQQQIEGAYRLSLFLEGKSGLAGGEILHNRAGFANACTQPVDSTFTQRCAAQYGEAIARHAGGLFNSAEKLELLIRELPTAELAGAVEQIIINTKMTPAELKVAMLQPLLAAGSRRLQIIARVWKGETLLYEEVESLGFKERTELMQYLLVTDWADKNWVAALLRRDEAVFAKCRAEHACTNAIAAMLSEVIANAPEYKGIESILLARIAAQKNEFALLNVQIDLMAVIEEYLRDGVLSSDDAKRLIAWSKKKKMPPVGAYPFIRNFLYPELVLADMFVSDTAQREKLLKFLILHQGFGCKELEPLGFNKEEYAIYAELIKKNKGVVDKVKGLLHFRKKD